MNGIAVGYHWDSGITAFALALASVLALVLAIPKVRKLAETCDQHQATPCVARISGRRLPVVTFQGRCRKQNENLNTEPKFANLYRPWWSVDGRNCGSAHTGYSAATRPRSKKKRTKKITTLKKSEVSEKIRKLGRSDVCASHHQ